MAEVVRSVIPIPTPEDWSPRFDGDFADYWIEFLREHRGEYWHPTEVWETHNEYQRNVLRQVAREEVLCADRLGDKIVGDPLLGYCYVRRVKPRWVRLAEPEPPGWATRARRVLRSMNRRVEVLPDQESMIGGAA